jgi:hypothetical protein
VSVHDRSGGLPAFSVMAVFCNRASGVLVPHAAGRGPSLHRHYPASPLPRPLPTPIHRSRSGYAFPDHRGALPRRDGSLRFLDRPLDTRRPLSPRWTERLHVPVPSSPMLASPALEGWPSTSFMSGPEPVHACALRLASSAFPGFAAPVTRSRRQVGYMFTGSYMVDPFIRQGRSGLA